MSERDLRPQPAAIASTIAVARELDPQDRDDALDLWAIARGIAHRDALRPGESAAWLDRFRWAMRDDAFRAHGGSPPVAPGPTAGEALAQAIAKAEAGAGHTIGARLDRFAVEHARRTEMEVHLGAPQGDWSLAFSISKLSATHPQASASSIATVAQRLSTLRDVLWSSAGPPRSTALASLGKVNDERPFLHPCRPMRVDVTAASQREVRDAATGRRVRVVGEAKQSQRPPLVLIHGHGSSMEEYELLRASLATRLAADVPVLGLDLPGCGYSEPTGGQYTVAGYAPLIVRTVRALGYGRMVVAGGSMGGNLSLQLACLGATAGVVGAIPWAPVAWGPMTLELKILGQLAQTMASLDFWEDGFWATYDVQKRTWYSPDWPDRDAALEASDRFRREIYSPDYHRAYFGLAADQSLDTHRDEANAIAVPVHLMAGIEDEGPYRVHSSAKALTSRIQGSTFFDEFTFGGHSLASEDPDLVAEHIAAFFRDRVP